MKLIEQNLKKTGLSIEQWKKIEKIFSHFSTIERVLVFGSRAQGNYSSGSDVDLAIQGQNFSHSDLLLLSGRLNEESDLPYQFDLVDYKKVQKKEFKEHIDQVGLVVLLYQT